MPRVAQPIEAHASFRFAVSISGITHAAFTECTLPSLLVETQEIKEGGLNEYTHQLPVRLKGGTITLRHGITKDASLLKWYVQVLNGQLEEALRTVSVIIYDDKYSVMMTIALQEAYPTKWGGPTLKTSEQSVAIEELQIAFHGIEVS